MPELDTLDLNLLRHHTRNKLRSIRRRDLARFGTFHLPIADVYHLIEHAGNECEECGRRLVWTGYDWGCWSQWSIDRVVYHTPHMLGFIRICCLSCNVRIGAPIHRAPPFFCLQGRRCRRLVDDATEEAALP
jgi:hypothetical protein